MEIITKEYKVYEFKELKSEVQEEVIEKLGERELGGDWWEHSGVLECIQEDLLEKYGISCDNVYFDINGRGYCSLGNPSIDDMEKFLMVVGAEKWMIAQSLDTAERTWDIGCMDISITVDQNGGYNGVYIENNGLMDVETEEENLDDIEKEMGIDFSEFLEDILKEKRKEIEEEQEYVSSRENIMNIIEMNEYSFLEDGEEYY